MKIKNERTRRAKIKHQYTHFIEFNSKQNGIFDLFDFFEKYFVAIATRF